MALGVERARARQLDHIHAPQAFAPVELNQGPAAAEALPIGEGKILDPAHANVAVDGYPFLIHELVVGHFRPLELAEAGPLAGLGFMPMRAANGVVHCLLRKKCLWNGHTTGPGCALRAVRRGLWTNSSIKSYNLGLWRAPTASS